MLNLIIGRENTNLDEVCMNSKLYFTRWKKAEWFEDDFAKRVIKTIDQADVLFGEALMNRFGKGMSTEQLCSGTKTLLLMRFVPDHIYYGTLMGDNCVPFIKELVEKSENTIHLLLEHYMDFPDDWEGLLMVNGKPASIEEYEDTICTWSMHYELTEEYNREKYWEKLEFPPELCESFPQKKEND